MKRELHGVAGHGHQLECYTAAARRTPHAARDRQRGARREGHEIQSLHFTTPCETFVELELGCSRERQV